MSSTYFIVLGTDHPDSHALREQVRPSHREWLREHHGHAVSVIHAGPTVDAQGRMNGTALVVEASDECDVRRFFDADPYSRAGLFASVEIRSWLWTFGRQESERQSARPVPRRD
ncbi:YciI family protein [Ramlibacter sp. WS9]|uniref:YciI family protein n=1 Tax=Ramlibacter sp. WS9 TaxID=1882741 RepID=UPI001143CD4B|nr:YciI family protein [Ramlibacter sp. WS9]ROZ75069.1 YciI family protein [Ramlibacter sp. WS9]